MTGGARFASRGTRNRASLPIPSNVDGTAERAGRPRATLIGTFQPTASWPSGDGASSGAATLSEMAKPGSPSEWPGFFLSGPQTKDAQKSFGVPSART
jgi:hypothetical protein